MTMALLQHCKENSNYDIQTISKLLTATTVRQQPVAFTYDYLTQGQTSVEFSLCIQLVCDAYNCRLQPDQIQPSAVNIPTPAQHPQMTSSTSPHKCTAILFVRFYQFVPDATYC